VRLAARTHAAFDRRSGGLPTISDALMAPIEMPTTQLGATPASTRLHTRQLGRPKRTTPVQQNFVIKPLRSMSRTPL